jgi:hypothetical protein
MNDQSMNDRSLFTTDADLEAALLDLGGALATPTAPDLARAVRLRVEAMGAPSAGRPRWLDRLIGSPGRPARRGLVLALAALLVLAGIAAALGFGLPGLRVIILGPTASPAASVGPGLSPDASRPSPTPIATPSPPSLESLNLGDPVDPSAAAAAVGYPVKLPTLAELDQPLGVYASGEPPGARLSAIYAANPAFPAGSNPPIVAGRAISIIVMEFPGLLDEDFLKKIIRPGTSIERQTVNGHEGFWISGEPHELFYLDPNRNSMHDDIRIVGNVLAWNDGNLTYRIEGASDLAAAMQIAESMH